MICIIKNDKYFVIATDMFLAGFMRFNFQNDKSSNFQLTREVIPQRPSNISLDTTEKQTGKVIFKSHVDHFIIYIYNIYREGKTRSNPAMKQLRGEQAKRDRERKSVFSRQGKLLKRCLPFYHRRVLIQKMRCANDIGKK